MKTPALIFVGAWLALSCAHHVGDVCGSTEAYCGGLTDDPNGGLSCREGKLFRYECSGPAGCHRDDATRKILCDQSAGAIAATPCTPDNEGKGQCSGTSLLQCVGGKWNQIACMPGQSCVADAGGVACR